MSIAKLSKQQTGWDRAISAAKKEIEKLETAVKIFEANKKSGEPWPRQTNALTYASNTVFKTLPACRVGSGDLARRR
jgi:hypothetical protein